MNIMIIGAGYTGIQLSKRLLNEGNLVTLIDNNQEIVEHTSNRLDCKVIFANGNNLQNLEDAGLAKADALVALTDSDEVNMITCSLVDAVYPDLLKIARVRNFSYYVNKEDAAKQHADSFANNRRPLYGIDYMINPDIEAADAIVNAIEHGAVSEVVSFGENAEFEITSLQVERGSKLDGVALKEIRNLTDKKFLIVFHETKEEDTDNVVTNLPFGDSILHVGDRVGVLTEKENIPEMLELCGTKIDQIKKIGLFGIGKIGSLVADRLIEKDKSSFIKKFFAGTKKVTQSVTIIDSDKKLCKIAQDKFPTARILNADITDEAFIEEEKINEFNLLICATHNHEMNMVVSAYMESLGVEKTIALVAQAEFSNIARKLGVDVCIPLRDTVVDSIISHLYGKSVTGIHSVSNGDFEIVECDISSSSKFVGKQLKDISGHGEFLVLLVRKPGSKSFELSNGNTMLSTGDHIVLIEKAGDKKILEKFSK